MEIQRKRIEILEELLKGKLKEQDGNLMDLIGIYHDMGSNCCLPIFGNAL